MFFHFLTGRKQNYVLLIEEQKLSCVLKLPILYSMQRKSCKTLLTIRNFQKKCERVLLKHQIAIPNCEL